jgi:hypothetical protein
MFFVGWTLQERSPTEIHTIPYNSVMASKRSAQFSGSLSPRRPQQHHQNQHYGAVEAGGRQDPGKSSEEEDGGTVDTHEHFSNRAPWLRAAVLGANDGLVSIAALLMGICAGGANRDQVCVSVSDAMLLPKMMLRACSVHVCSLRSDVAAAVLKAGLSKRDRTRYPDCA